MSTTEIISTTDASCRLLLAPSAERDESTRLTWQYNYDDRNEVDMYLDVQARRDLIAALAATLPAEQS